MEEISALDAALLVGGGLLSGVVNTLAGGGSLLTVPLLVLLGLPGSVANGTNRVGVLLQGLVASRRFRLAGVVRPGQALRVWLPVAAGTLLGAAGVSQLDDVAFERLFGVAMLVLIVPILRQRGSEPRTARAWHPALSGVAFFAIGCYAGAIQAGVGVPLLLVLVHAGHDLLRANAIKVAVITLAMACAVPVFALQGQIAWVPALLLGAGFAAGGELGARIAVAGGERLIRPFLALAVLALAARMLGVF